MSSDAPYIAIRDLKVGYLTRDKAAESLLVLDGLTLDIAKGQFVSIVGPNGCGKTTLLSCVAGLLQPSHGSILVAGREPKEASCGYVFQNYRESLFPWLNIQDNIAFSLRLNGVTKSAARARVVELLRRLGIDLPLARYPYALSGGQQQLTAILRAVIHEPNVLLLDEPFGSLDAAARAEVRDTMQDIWRATDSTAVFVSHDLGEAIYLADTVVALSRRPATIRECLKVDLPRPRRRDDLYRGFVAEHRARIEAAMGLTATEATNGEVNGTHA